MTGIPPPATSAKRDPPPTVVDAPRPADLIYIVGTHRSGGTMLGTILSRGAGVFYAGEIYRFPYPIFDPGDPLRGCSCGSTVAQCPFWTGIQADAQSSPRLLPELRQGQIRYDAWPRLPFTLLKFFRHDPGLGRYAGRMEEFVRILAARSQSSVIVESSFSPLRGILYRRAPPGEGRIRFIHLVRDGRSFFASETGPIPQGVEAGTPLQRAPPAVVARWMIFHLAAIALCSGDRRSYLRVRFEDVLQRPRETLGAIQEFLEIDLSEAIDLVESHRPFPMTHICAGNRSRLAGSLVVRPELAVPPKLSRAHTALFWMMAGWLALLFGYRPGAGKAPGRPRSGD
ncbi:MAG TPA: hypothetical protein VN842_00395 [Thermoplasmata archaeon]|nr:hypothetical protein [Thermoplasmata archaeon]